jgi:ParB family chromosome partitioning protein
MSKRELLSEGLANVRESMGDFGDTVHRAPMPGPRALPAHLRGVVRSKDVSQIEVDRIDRDPEQPREEFDSEGLGRLAHSLLTRGQLQPISVRWDEGRGVYLIVCGERRWRAAKMAGLPTLTCVILKRPAGPGELLALQLVENALREDLTGMEQARAYKQLLDLNGWSARQLAGELAIHHAQVVRAMALLQLPAAVQEQVDDGGLPPATAYEVSKLEDPEAQAAMAQAAVEQKLTRSEVAEAVKAVKARRPSPNPKPEPVELDLGEGVIVIVKYRKASSVTATQALRKALKALQDRDRSDDQAA